MGLFDQFPSTDLHTLNLDWIMRAMKTLEDVYDGLKKEIQDTIDFVNNFEEHADQLIDDRIAVALSLYVQRLNALQAQVDRLEEELNKDDGVLGMIQGLREKDNDLQLQINNLQHSLTDQIFRLEQLMHKYKYDLTDLVDSKVELLEQYIKDEVTTLDRLDVINPLNGIFENIQNVLNDMADIINRSFGLTAEQFDKLKLTARVFDGYHITAYDFSTKGYFELWLKLTFDLMRSPFDGKITRFETVIYRLADLHKCSLTAQEFDNRQFTAEQFDSFGVTAYIFDWLSYPVLRKITAALFDSLRLEGQQFDDKKIVAKEFDRWAYPLYGDILSGCSSRGACGDYQILAGQIADLASRVNTVTAAKAGTTYTFDLPKGETEFEFATPNVYEDTVVYVEAETKPKTLLVTPHEGVKIIWAESVTKYDSLSFNVTLAESMGWQPSSADTSVIGGMLEDIANLQNDMSVVKGAKAGITYVWDKISGQSETYVHIPEITNDSFVDIMCAIKPKKLSVVPGTGVTVYWDDQDIDTALSFNVNVQNAN